MQVVLITISVDNGISLTDDVIASTHTHLFYCQLTNEIADLLVLIMKRTCEVQAYILRLLI